ncbi:hydrogenase maturation protein HypF [Paenibacillus forsythiae]|uniref:Carbamoyltransferase n=1 Tax=Paenibacillus forsythiae TaxID=365616 RepID=A0ABU3H966_9BACL|nr:carbamoyltransferase HypF [Paenibacillus forsythiae]MDT3427374.1 hydrogenase maturation protein HypF [Paenibacillus forsythiae]
MLSEVIRVDVQVKGIVQGVGFRPFVYRLAQQHDLTGWVVNDAGGVRLEAEGHRPDIDAFLVSLRTSAPPLSHIEELTAEVRSPAGYAEFRIKESVGAGPHEVRLSPDIGVCEDCLAELKDPDNRRFRYPYINCTNCGPRFTITVQVPYDRKHTTIRDFGLCEDCAKEYHDPANRRFHAQPVSCPVCGPSVYLLDASGKRLNTADPVACAAEQLKSGSLLAIKGLGGYHLACDATQEEAVRELRARKRRDGKPFAVMADTLETVLRICAVTEKERELLMSPRRPIVLLPLKTEARGLLPAADCLSPDNDMLGVMLPYTPLQHLLFQEGLELMVMTSGNRSGEPIVYRDEEAVPTLQGIADYYLAGELPIHMRTDDTVTSVFREREYVIRRSRGYVPYPVDLTAAVPSAEGEPHKSGHLPILALGGELKNTFCLVKDRKAFVSHHIGDLDNLETLDSLIGGAEHFQQMFAAKAGVLAYDMHPGYRSSQYASEQQNVVKIPVQHHHAHIASCMAENGVSGPVIGVAFDGTGLGEDGHIWGGEFFAGDYGGFERMARFGYVPLPGGDAAVKEPWRMALSYVMNEEAAEPPADWLNTIEPYKRDIVKRQILQRINTPLTSSVGRLFDAVSSLAGLCHYAEYEGQAAIRLERAADKEASRIYPYDLKAVQGVLEIGTAPLIRELVREIREGVGISEISGAFHRTLAAITGDVCRRIRSERGLNEVALSGGVFQNRLLLAFTVDELERSGFRVWLHSKVPANDGGLSLGQAAIALGKYLTQEGMRESCVWQYPEK